ncbi:MAG: hypothetical protein ACI9JL_001833 [Paracoccaceae bacterium]
MLFASRWKPAAPENELRVHLAYTARVPSVLRTFKTCQALRKTDQILFDDNPTTPDILTDRPDIIFKRIQPVLNLFEMASHNRFTAVKPAFQFVQQQHWVRQRRKVESVTTVRRVASVVHHLA